ncbi:MAG TPA: ATP-binding protein [Methylomirabilota bacterium]|nr:ATP-binding protein [Methylomirabilota bacterium]
MLPSPILRSRKLRSHLVDLTLITLLPMIVFAVIASVLVAQRERANFQRSATDLTFALLTAIDAELEGSITALEVLATSHRLDTDDLAGFHAEAARVLRSHPTWATIHLARPSGQQIVNVLRPFGAELPMVSDRPSLKRVVKTGRPVISGLVENELLQERMFSVRVPVVRSGVTPYVLSAVVKPQAISAILSAQRLPSDWVVVVLDGDQRIVARTLAPERTVGQPASDSLRAALARAPHGWFHGSTLEGTEVYTPYHRSRFSGWTVAMGVPAPVVNASARATWWAMGAGVAASGLLAFVLALMFGRRIAGPIVSLATAAKAIGRGEPVQIDQQSRIEEVKELGRTLAEAAVAIRSREQALRESEERFATLAEAMPQLVWTADPSGQVDYFNRRWHDYTGAPPMQAVGRGWINAVHSDERETVWARWQRALERGEPIEIEHRLRGVDGRYQWFLGRGVPYRDAAGRIVKWFGTFTNIEGQKRAEERLRAADRAKDEFLAMLGHELRNPLGAIAGAVRVLQSAPTPDERGARAREVIGRQLTHLSRLVDDLLDVTRVTMDKTVLTREPLNLADVVTNVLATWRSSGRLEGHRVIVNVTPVWVDADETRIEQIVSNLLANAVKYTASGGDVTVRVKRDGAAAVLEVADTGVGIPPNLLDRVFDLFVQADAGLDRRQGGLGIGLTLVKRLVELHGGQVRASSDGPGRGSMFTVTLPSVDAPSQPRRSGAGRRPNRRCRVLIVEDNNDAREMLSLALSLDGHEVHEAVDGTSGLAKAIALRPDVALIDVGLPGLDGYEVARRLATVAGRESMRLIAITGYGQAEDRRRALDAGFDAHVTKPVPPDQLAELLDTVTVGKDLPLT